MVEAVREYGNKADGNFMWYMDTSKIECQNCNSEEWQNYMSVLEPAEKEKVMKYYLFDDKKRALLSLALQKSIIRQQFGGTNNDFKICRTREEKPYAVSDKFEIGKWNFNVSHHGRYVCIASHSKRLVGLDIVDILHRSRSIKNANDYVDMFYNQLDPREIIMIKREKSENAKFSHFFVHWSLKEAYIKAIGQGLGFNLKDICFSVRYSKGYVRGTTDRIIGTATVTLRGVQRNDWSFDFFSLDERHVMTVARGPLTEAIPSYQETAWKDVDDSGALRSGSDADSGATTVETELDDDLPYNEDDVEEPPSCASSTQNCMWTLFGYSMSPPDEEDEDETKGFNIRREHSALCMLPPFQDDFPNIEEKVLRELLFPQAPRSLTNARRSGRSRDDLKEAASAPVAVLAGASPTSQYSRNVQQQKPLDISPTATNALGTLSLTTAHGPVESRPEVVAIDNGKAPVTVFNVVSPQV